MDWRGSDGLADIATRIVRDTFKDPGGVTYTPSGGPSYQLDAPFDEAWEELDWSQPGLAVASSSPVVDIRLADLPVDPEIGAIVEVDGRTFEVEDIRVGSHGTSAKLILLEL